MNKLNSQIVNNTKYIEYLKSLYKEVDKKYKISYLKYMTTCLAVNVTTTLSDPFIENELNKISQTIELDTNQVFTPNSFLHVMSESYGEGGHTKLVELFIKNIDSNEDKHSILLLNQLQEIPQSLYNSLKDDSQLIVFDKDTDKNKAQKLANIACKYRYIILHIHPEDTVANLAFGNKKFQRPIIFLNHADHKFWCGVSISDITLDLSTDGSLISRDLRGVHNSKIVHIPIENKNINIDKDEARKYLKISKDKKIILSIASEFKYGTTAQDIEKFTKLATEIVSTYDDCKFILIGPSRDNKYWNKAYIATDAKIDPLGIIKRDELKYYIACADLYIESFPFSSYTAFLDTAIYNIKILTLKTPISTLDVVKENHLQSNSVEALTKNAISFLKNSNTEQNNIDLSIHLKEKWSNNLYHILSDVKEHQLYTFHPKTVDNNYLNHIDKVMGSCLVLDEVYTDLPFYVRVKLMFGLLKFHQVNSFDLFLKLLRRTLRGSKNAA
ncbi:MAG: hypothetical protein U9N33_00335 [Campylobacterota bacterium]|nr:hypothetical protein [Campylobacterota bacterium]